ncbi:unnamed protein product [Protopolystoma xenopodis]|uniref:Uncharacterized protein n=1 Tax=Protopolystoma xenopodis TaxID=117903 RepID=A0A3S5BUA2_9PLAT|nr:unnamed protein product [Protopolystoma xenopodis]
MSHLRRRIPQTLPPAKAASRPHHFPPAGKVSSRCYGMSTTKSCTLKTIELQDHLTGTIAGRDPKTQRLQDGIPPQQTGSLKWPRQQQQYWLTLPLPFDCKHKVGPAISAKLQHGTCAFSAPTASTLDTGGWNNRINWPAVGKMTIPTFPDTHKPAEGTSFFPPSAFIVSQTGRPDRVK